jgi:hypothetical protein
VIVISVIFGFFVVGLSTWLAPNLLFPETAAGAYRQFDNFRGDPRMPVRVEELGPGSAVGDIVRERCPLGWRTEPFQASRHESYSANMFESVGADTDVLCRTPSDYFWSVTAVVLAFGLLPLIAFIGRATLKWIGAGK